MASNVCNVLTASLLSRRCLVPGGIKTRAWVGQVLDFGARTYNAAGAVSSFALAPGAHLIAATSRVRKGSGATKFTQAIDAFPSAEQTVTLEFIYNTPQEARALIDFLRADGKTVFLETNGGTIRQYFADFGHQTSEGDETTGLLIADAANVLKVTLKGIEQDLPLFFEAVPTAVGGDPLAASRAYLDALVVAAPAALPAGTTP